ncbi:MAG: hypothetical protein M3Q38_09045 [Chloroflexota bacterium]|nr:hypothetical protein [Chloroflexota bacterium]
MNRTRATVVGMVHLGPLPGAANGEGGSIEGLIERALNDTRLLNEGGFDAILIQNASDHPPTRLIDAASLAAYACIAREVRRTTTLQLGISVLKSDVQATFAIARSAEADFVRLKSYVGSEIGPEGTLEGCAAEAVRTRRTAGLESIEIWADAVQPTSRPAPQVSPLDLVRWSFEFGKADRVIITGDTLGESTVMLHEVRAAVAGPLLLGGGADPETIGAALEDWDGVIVGRYLRGGDLRAPIDPSRVAALRAAAGAR